MAETAANASMDQLAFIAALVDSLAWPIAVIVLVILLRTTIVRLLPKLRSLKYGDLELDFGQELEIAEVKAEKISEEHQIVSVPDKDIDANFEQILESAPSLAVVHAWLPVEQALDKLAEMAGIQLGRKMSGLQNTRLLFNREIIDEQTAGLLHELRALRNTAAHYSGSAAITAEQAKRYRQLAETVLSVLRDTAAKLEANKPGQSDKQGTW